jgi:hypothetical protein
VVEARLCHDHAQLHSAERLEPLGEPPEATQGGPILTLGEDTTTPTENGKSIHRKMKMKTKISPGRFNSGRVITVHYLSPLILYAMYTVCDLPSFTVEMSFWNCSL